MIPRRYLLITCTFLLSVLLYVDRTCISTAKGVVGADLGLSKEQWSWVLASFAYLPESSKGNEAFFYTAAALSGVAIVCWLLANPGRKDLPCVIN